MLTPGVLAVLGLLLAGPAPAAVARLPRVRRTPRAAMLLWQALALGGVLAAVGAGLALVTERGVGRHGPPSYAVAVLALLATAVVLGRLLLSAHRVGVRLRRLRRRHRHLLDVLAPTQQVDGPGSARLRVLQAGSPVAYCLPGFAGARVVVSRATLERLGPLELDAVLAHERAHLRARHDLVLEAFTVLHQAFPVVVTGTRALAEVRLLIEVLADRAALTQVGATPLVRALSSLTGTRSPEIGLGVAGTGLVARLECIRDRGPHRVQAVMLVCAAVAVLLLPTVLVVVPYAQHYL